MLFFTASTDPKRVPQSTDFTLGKGTNHTMQNLANTDGCSI